MAKFGGGADAAATGRSNVGALWDEAKGLFIDAPDEPVPVAAINTEDLIAGAQQVLQSMPSPRTCRQLYIEKEEQFCYHPSIIKFNERMLFGISQAVSHFGKLTHFVAAHSCMEKPEAANVDRLLDERDSMREERDSMRERLDQFEQNEVKRAERRAKYKEIKERRKLRGETSESEDFQKMKKRIGELEAENRKVDVLESSLEKLSREAAELASQVRVNSSRKLSRD